MASNLLFKKKEINLKNSFIKLLKTFSICILLSTITSLFLKERLFINNSPSVNIGLYWKDNNIKNLNKDDIVFYKMTPAIRQFLKDSNILKEEHKFILKKVGGIEGDHIIIKDDKLFINDIFIYNVIGTTSDRKDLKPIENLDYILQKDEYFLIGDIEKSYDSRYFGVIKKEDIVGKGKLLFSPK